VIAPLAAAGHLTTVTMMYSALDKVPVSHKAKMTLKKQKETKFEYIVVEGTNCTTFIECFLTVFNLVTVYSPGIHSGPAFKMWYTSSRYVLLSAVPSLANTMLS
jgi:hypothetical protein